MAPESIVEARLPQLRTILSSLAGKEISCWTVRFSFEVCPLNCEDLQVSAADRLRNNGDPFRPSLEVLSVELACFVRVGGNIWLIVPSKHVQSVNTLSYNTVSHFERYRSRFQFIVPLPIHFVSAPLIAFMIETREQGTDC